METFASKAKVVDQLVKLANEEIYRLKGLIA
jgi:hypothetical protein